MRRATRQGLRAHELAAAVGVTPATINHLEAGQSLPSLELLVRLADVLETSTDYLLGRRRSWGVHLNQQRAFLESRISTG